MLAQTVLPDRGSRVSARDDETKALRVARDDRKSIARGPLATRMMPSMQALEGFARHHGINLGTAEAGMA